MDLKTYTIQNVVVTTVPEVLAASREDLLNSLVGKTNHNRLGRDTVVVDLVIRQEQTVIYIDAVCAVLPHFYDLLNKTSLDLERMKQEGLITSAASQG